MELPRPPRPPLTVEVDVAADVAELAGDALWQAGAIAIGESVVDGQVRLTAGFSDPDSAAAGARSVSEHRPAVVTSVDDDSYLDSWREFATCVRVGAVVIRPAWVTNDDARPGDVVVELEPGRAFGSGAHPTTQLALAALQTLGCAGQRVLDVGTGSGVLAIAADLLGAREVVALDHDPVAVAVATANVARNQVQNGVAVGEWRVEDVPGAFDLVVANLGGVNVLRSLAPALLERLGSGGWLLAGGLIAGTEDGAIAAFPGLRVASIDRVGDWVALTLER